ncbi:MAG: hypothetical protein ABSE69_05965 [Roseiarcus sp.]|jgi:hypothetical protein
MAERPDPPYASKQARQRAMTIRLALFALALAGLLVGLLAKRFL